jgi:hypothetical protein
MERENPANDVYVANGNGEDRVPGLEVTDNLLVWGEPKWPNFDQTQAEIDAGEDPEPLPGRLRGEVYRSTTPTKPATSATQPANTVKVRADSRAVLRTPGKSPDGLYKGMTGSFNNTIPDEGSGWYSWRWCLDPSLYSKNNQNKFPSGGPWCDKFFQDSETFVVPMDLELETQVPADKQILSTFAEAGDTVSIKPKAGDIWLAGADGSAPVVTLTGRLCDDGSLPVDHQPVRGCSPIGSARKQVTLPITGSAAHQVSVTPADIVSMNQVGSRWAHWEWSITSSDNAAAKQVIDQTKVYADAAPFTNERTVKPMALEVRSDIPANKVGLTSFGDMEDRVYLKPSTGDTWMAGGDGSAAQVTLIGDLCNDGATPVDKQPNNGQCSSIGWARKTVTLPTSGNQEVRVDITSSDVQNMTPVGSTHAHWKWRVASSDNAAARQVIDQTKAYEDSYPCVTGQGGCGCQVV